MTNLIEEITAISIEMPPLQEETARQEVTRLLDLLVREKGRDYIYPRAARTVNGIEYPGSCQYVDTEWDGEKEDFDYSPSCILGHLLHKVDVPLTQLLALNEDGYFASASGLGTPERWLEDEELIDALGHLQSDQDTGTPWGIAVDRYKHYLEHEDREAAVFAHPYDREAA